MLIEIRKAGFTNKGAELMLHAIIQQIKNRYPDSQLVITPNGSKGSVSYLKAAKLGFRLKTFFWKFGIQWGDLAALLPHKLRERYGLILDREVHIVIDAAGFAYTDQWGGHTSKELARSSKRWVKRGTKLILMPQAFGPFNVHTSAKDVRTFVDNASLVYARDEDSHNYLISITGERPHLKICPDFTNLVEGQLPNNFKLGSGSVAIIPNCRMIDKTTQAESRAYLPFMIHCTQYIQNHGLEPFVLVHEGEGDYQLAKEISDQCGGIPVVREVDPIYIKGIIGGCTATIGSRFHGLVSSLSQGVPSLATGWSHKYQRLFQDYDFPEGILSVLDDKNEIDRKIDLLVQTAQDPQRRKAFTERSEVLKDNARVMWKEVFQVIDASYKADAGAATSQES
jgi:colanic acid/amylovoran biosynthesis protein